jgi:group I intron endonuclease
MSRPAVYIIENVLNGHRYVGSAVRVGSRWYDHRRQLRSGTHHSRHLQYAWNKYGEAAFSFQILEEWEPQFLRSMEQWWMNMLRPEYNMAPNVRNPLGMHHSLEARAKMSAALVGNKKFLGHHHTAETKAKISAANKGKNKGKQNALGHKCTPEARLRMSTSQRRRWSRIRTGGS